MQQGIITPNQLEAGLNSWLGNIRFGKAKYMENTLFYRIRDKNVNLVRHPNGSWRILELPKYREGTFKKFFLSHLAGIYFKG